LLGELKRYDEAEEEYRNAIKLKPDYVYAHYNLGYLFLLTGKKLEAKEELLVARALFEKQGNIDGVEKCDKLLKDL